MKTQYILVILITSILVGCRHTQTNSLPITISYSELKSNNAHFTDGTNAPYTHPQYDTIKTYADSINAEIKTKLQASETPLKDNIQIILTSSKIETYSTFPPYMIKSANIGVYLDVPSTHLPTNDEERTQLHSQIKSILNPLAKKLNGKLEDNKFLKK